ncbi:Hok/Gef family protein [Serratia sp. M24T3]|nr:putative cell killing protein [Serratia sp. M24T3]
MPTNIKVAPHLLKRKGKHAMNSLMLFIAGLIVICVTLLSFTWMTRDSLCEIRFSDGIKEVVALMACETTR